MATKYEVMNPLSDYEMDAMWMSYRYAIGRHSIASVMHAGKLLQAVYDRLEGTTIAQLAKDFNRTQGAIRARLKKFGLIE